MQKRTNTEVHNWFGDIRFNPRVVVRPRSVKELVSIVRGTDEYPSPVRASGSTHSMTRCVVADGGTVVDMTGMDGILHIGEHTVTAEAGALYIDVAQALQSQGMQFHINTEIGNLTMGSAACTHTKDGSFPGEYGLISSYAIGMKVVTPAGGTIEVTEEQPELLRAMRTSYGLLGIVYEVTFRIKPLRPLMFHHKAFSIDEFERQFSALKGREEAMAYYLFPFQDSITVEFRRYREEGVSPTDGSWRLRNLAQSTVGPRVAGAISRYVPGTRMRNLFLGLNDRITQAVLNRQRGEASIPTEQIIRYPEGAPRWTFSIWAFPENSFPRVLREYFAFCKTYQSEHGYRYDMLSVGYRVNEDSSSLLSYSRDGAVMTVDPVCSGGPGWPEFLDAFNEFCSRNGGLPLLNQTPRLTPEQVEQAFGERLETFRSFQQRFDPGNRLLNRYFEELLDLPGVTDQPRSP